MKFNAEQSAPSAPKQTVATVLQTACRRTVPVSVASSVLLPIALRGSIIVLTTIGFCRKSN